jgi:hypothetical protein
MTSLTDPALAYRNAIVTLLIERPTMRRGEIRAELCPSGDPIQLHRIDRLLRMMVAAGELSQPRLGYYEIAALSLGSNDGMPKFRDRGLP